MGAGLASLAARLLSLGLADLRGHLGIGVDEGAWIGTAFNASTMFIGPLTVYLGALLGARRVLLVCSGVFAIVSACLPFAHSYSVVDRAAGDCRSQLRDLLPADHQLRAAERSAQVPGAHARRVCDVYRGRRELCAVALRLLSGSPVVGRGCSGRPRSWRRSWRRASITAFPASRSTEAVGTETELRRIPVRQRRARAAVRRARPGTTARLVAVERVHGAVHDRNLLPPVRRDPSSAPAQSAGRSARSSASGTPSSWDSAVFAFRFCCSRPPWSSRRRWRSADSTPRNSVRPCCGRRSRRCVSRSSRPTC